MKILVVDDERKMGVILKGALEDAGHRVTALERSADALKLLESEPFDLLITDLKMAPPDGLALMKEARRRRPDLPVILMTAYASAQTAVEAMRHGAYDYLIKPFELDEMVLRVNKIAREQELGENLRVLERENAVLQQASGSRIRLGTIIGKSAVMGDVFELAEKVAGTDATVLIRGESGTGKSLLARAVHAGSPRAQGPFITVNCGALPENLLESELFGHEKGAFTGAVGAKSGRFVSANTGTIFLDEVGEMSPSLQVKLLQVIEDREFYPVGSDRSVSVDVRILAATNRNLEDAIAEGEFREDLFYRLNVFPIVMPPLKVRKEDVFELLGHFLARFGRSFADLSEASRTAMATYGFPGNVRELENMVERAAILAGGEPIELRHFPTLTQSTNPGSRVPFVVPEIPDEGLSLETLERELILKALDKSGGNKTRAAEYLGLTRRTLYSRLERYGLSPGSGSKSAGE